VPVQQPDGPVTKESKPEEKHPLQLLKNKKQEAEPDSLESMLADI